MTKSELRKSMSDKRNRLTTEEIYKKSADIFKNIINMGIFKNVKSVFTFVNYKSECDTSYIIDYCIANKIRIAVPKVNGERMDFYLIKSKADLLPGTFGILEPYTKEVVVPDESSVIIMPGLVFDSKGNRIGYGGGYYDKYISIHNLGIKVSICFDFQIIENNIIKSESTDIKPDFIVTENRVLKISQND